MTVEDIADLIASTVKKLPPMQFTQIAQKLTSYHVYPTLFKNRGGKEMETRIGSGTCIPFTALVKTAGSAKNVLIYDTDTTNIADGLVEGEVPWRYSTFSYFFNQHEFEQNSGAKQLFNLIKDRREQALLDFADLLEGNYFGKPVDSTDKRTPWGLFYWLVKTSDATSATSTCGFKGGAPSGFSDVGGINPTNYPMWKNYTAPYYSIKDWDNSGTTVKGDFVNKLKRASTTPTDLPLGGEELESPSASSSSCSRTSPLFRHRGNAGRQERPHVRCGRRQDVWRHAFQGLPVLRHRHFGRRHGQPAVRRQHQHVRDGVRAGLQDAREQAHPSPEPAQCLGDVC